MWLTFELIRSLTHTTFTCKNEEDQNKNEGSRVSTTFLPLLVYGDFPGAQGQLTPQAMVESGPTLQFVRDFMFVLVTFNNKEDQIENEGNRVTSIFQTPMDS